MYGIPYSLLGARLAGDIGGVTCYTDRFGRKTVYPIAPPKHNPTPQQLTQRSLFATAHATWKALTPEEKKKLEQAATASALCMTGKNLYMSACLLGADDNLQAIARQVGIDLPHAPDLRTS